MEKTYLQQVGERLQKCRNHNFLSRKALSKQSGVSISTIVKMEHGNEAVGIEDAIKICKGLGYSTEYILTGNCGLSEFVKMNQQLLSSPDINYANLEKIATAFWETCPKYFK